MVGSVGDADFMHNVFMPMKFIFMLMKNNFVLMKLASDADEQDIPC